MKHIYLILFALMLVVISSCDRSRFDKGREYFPDMAHSLAFETYTDNEVFEHNSSALQPVEGTIPREMIPYPYPNTFEGRELAGVNLQNPLKLSAEILQQGQKQYEIFCINCHGTNGDGNGNLYTSKKYIVQPKSLITEQWKELPGGEMYHVITIGQGVMGAHGSQINPENRWKIVHYIQQELQK